jgi:cytidylate kinase
MEEAIMINIAIDGPAGAGKSTIAKTVSKELGYIYVDTGALYRTVCLNALRKGVDTKDAESVIATLDGLEVSLRFVDNEQRVFLGEEDVSAAIRQNEVSMAASNVSAIPRVREFLFDLQRNIAKNNNCLMDGRDIGTVVLPDAQIKLFLTASAEARADRRYKELIEKGQTVDYDVIPQEIKDRDYQDSHREIAPLKQADDAILVDSTEMNLQETIDYMLNLIKERI